MYRCATYAAEAMLQAGFCFTCPVVDSYEFWKSFIVRDDEMLICEVWAAITHFCMNGIWKKCALARCMIVKDAVLLRI
jgi:hypothetical protein